MPRKSTKHVAREILKGLNREDLWRFLERARAQIERGVELFTKRLLQIVFAWSVAIGVSLNAFREGALQSLALRDLSPILWIAPLLIAIIYYDAVMHITACGIATDVMLACYAALFPQVPTDNFEAIDILPNFMEVEQAVAEKATGALGGFLKNSSAVIMVIVLIGPLIAVGHTSYLLGFSAAPFWLKLAVMPVAVFMAIRAIVLSIMAP